MKRSKTFRHLLLAAIASCAMMVAVPARAQNVKVGAIYPMTGSASFLGIPEERALRMKLDEINKAGGVNGHKIELIVYDTEGNPTKAAHQLRRLVESDKVDVIFGPSSSGESLATVALVNDSKVPQIAHAGTEMIVNPVTRYVFNSVPTDRVAIAHMLGFFQKRGYRTLAFLSSADGYGQSGKKMLDSLVDKFGIKVVAAEEFNRQDPDITAQVLRVRQSNADAVIVWSALPAPTVILRNAGAVGFDKPIFVGYGAASTEMAEKAGPAGEGVYISSFRLLAPESLEESDPVRPVTLKLHRDYMTRYKEAPANFAQHSYDAALILEAALRKINGPVTRESLRDAIETVSVVGANGRFQFTPTNHGGLDNSSSPLIMLQYVNRSWRPAK